MTTGQNTGPALRVEALKYSYGKARAVDGVGFEIHAGEIFGLLGPNGAGKTTTISIISGLLPAESGRALVFGQEAGPRAAAARARMGVVP
jgi:ABC-2 type transport system ATP-binding protein